MSAEKAANYSVEVSAFLDSLFDGQEGYVYTPTKNPESGYWQPYYFQWPKQRDAIVTHLMTQSEVVDTYVAPSLFKAPSDKKQAWKGSNFIWTEFDGNAPSKTPEGIPEPSIRVRSSEQGHEHWYWRLNDFEKDSDAIEAVSKKLAYTLDADKSAWDCSQVLRSPGTIHHESQRRVTLLSNTPQKVTFGSFKNLVVPPDSAVIGTTFKDVPPVDEVVSRYKWEKEAFNLFKKQNQPVGSRSSAMTRLGFHCIEMGMTNEECYAILLNADDRWGKYKNRPPADRAKRLIGIISHCRGKKELDAELRLSDRESFISLGDFRKTDIKAKWLYTNFITEQGLGIISAAPGVGKTTLSMRLGFSVVLRRDFLIWKCAIQEQKKVGFLSLEMSGVECKKFVEDMWPSFTPAEQDNIDENFFILPLGYSMALGDKKHQQLILDEIDKHGIDFLIIDSLKAATALDERKMDSFFDWVNKYVRNDRKVTVWIIHHNRKPPNEGPRKPKDLSDLYGDTFITAHPTTVISLWRSAKGKFEVLPLKIRLAEEADPFSIVRTQYLDFETNGEKVKEEDTSESVDKSHSVFA